MITPMRVRHIGISEHTLKHKDNRSELVNYRYSTTESVEFMYKYMNYMYNGVE